MVSASRSRKLHRWAPTSAPAGASELENGGQFTSSQSPSLLLAALGGAYPTSSPQVGLCQLIREALRILCLRAEYEVLGHGALSSRYVFSKLNSIDSDSNPKNFS